MKQMNRTAVFVCLAFAALAIVFFGLCSAFGGTPKATRCAMQKISGYSFVFEGRTNLIEKTSWVRSFQNQHPMMEYLVLVADEFERCGWEKRHPIRIEETEDKIIIIWPSQGELAGKTIYWGSDYRERVIIDKRTKSIVSMRCG